MIDVHTIIQHPAVLSVGWALVHALWVGTVLAVGLWLALRLMPDRPNVRYSVSAAALVAIPLMTALALVVHQPWADVVYPIDEAAAISPRLEGAEAESVLPVVSPSFQGEFLGETPGQLPGEHPGVALPLSVEVDKTLVLQGEPVLADPVAASGTGFSAYLPYAAVLYVLGLCVMSLRLLGGWWLTLRLRTRGLSPLPGDLARLAERAQQRSGVKRAVRFAISSRAAVPCVVGVFKPIVLLPAAAATGLTPAQLSSIFAHELAHVRRHDVLINLVQVLIETLFFFHPAVWWVGKQLRAERECRCDDDAVVSVGSPLVYADALAAVAGLDASQPSLSLAATDGGLSHRVRRLLAPNTQTQGRSTVWGASLLAVLIVGTVLTVVACAEATRDGDESDSDAEQVDAEVSADDENAASSGLAEPPAVDAPRILEIDYEKLKAGDLRYNVVIRPGDVISVPDATNAGFVYTSGSIPRPGAYTIPGDKELTALRLIASAGGLADLPEPDEGKVWGVDVIRQQTENSQDVYRVTLEGLQTGTEPDIYLQANDIINLGQLPLQKVTDFVQPKWAQEQLAYFEKHPSDHLIRILYQEGPKAIDRVKLSPITEADLTATNEPYVIGSGDTIKVSIFELQIPGVDDIQKRRVDEKGDVELTLLGLVEAVGRTTQQLAKEIAQALDESNYMRDATVHVEVVQSQSNVFNVLGQTANTGSRSGIYIIPKPDFRVIEAIATFGGVPSRTKYIYVIRDGDAGDAASELIGQGPGVPVDRVVPSDLGAGGVSSHSADHVVSTPPTVDRDQLEQWVATFAELDRLLESEDNSEEVWQAVSQLSEGSDVMAGLMDTRAMRLLVEKMFRRLEIARDEGNVDLAKQFLRNLASIQPSIAEGLKQQLAAARESEVEKGDASEQDSSAPALEATQGSARQEGLIEAWHQKRPLAFGRVVEAEIALGDDAGPVFLDLDAHKLVTLPKSIDRRDSDAVRAWAVQNTMPISFVGTEEGFELQVIDAWWGVRDRSIADEQTRREYPELVDRDGRYIVSLREGWEGRDARQLMQTMFNSQWASIRFGGGLPQDEAAERERLDSFKNARFRWTEERVPAYLQFWDTKGHLGVLQVLGFDKAKGVVQIRYKLVVTGDVGFEMKDWRWISAEEEAQWLLGC